MPSELSCRNVRAAVRERVDTSRVAAVHHRRLATPSRHPLLNSY